jgi:hypothetical protein
MPRPRSGLRSHVGSTPSTRAKAHRAGHHFVSLQDTVAATCRQQGRHLLAFPLAAGQAASRGSPPPSLLPTGQGG